jgi:pilus assembly protein Flp/PilA
VTAAAGRSERAQPMKPLQYARLEEFWMDEAGATSIEYAMIAAGIAVAIVSAVQLLGTKVTALFTSVLAGFH